ncbi:MAG: hypothetical protein Q8T09_12825 [Candidatus Melainabacteria bacterium]|nr:hypothetical protein [Candidatus Melainabacteria bacterium]
MKINWAALIVLAVTSAQLVNLTTVPAYATDNTEVDSRETLNLKGKKDSPLSAVCKVLEPSDIFAFNNKIDWNTAKTRLTKGEDFTTYTFAVPQVVQSQLYTCLFDGRRVDFPMGGYLFFETAPTVAGSKTFSPDGSINRFKGGDFAFSNANPGQVIGVCIPVPPLKPRTKPTGAVHMYKSTRSPYVLKYFGSDISHGFINDSDGDFGVNITVNDFYPQDDQLQIRELSKVHTDVMCNVVVLTNAGLKKLRTP